ncbi:hypothetical protein [Micromonospora aurantiaca (nom. illeg.)]|uniref:hypothetical protein n=1 Tax=Micromonospora aurantiaca (nom. illeg.) TaxID=47850 RepID=UPI003EC01BCA
MHTIEDGRGRNLTSHLTPGQDHDTRQLVRLLDDVAVARPGRIGRPRKRLDSLSTDKAYSSRSNRRALRARSSSTTSPKRRPEPTAPGKDHAVAARPLSPAPLPAAQQHRTADEPAQAVPGRGHQVRLPLP